MKRKGMKRKSQEETKTGKRRKGQRSKVSKEHLLPSLAFFFSVVCCEEGNVVVTREMLTGLYLEITIPRAGRQIAGDKASPD